ncbi:hypothetical protein AKO1_012460, partial [Acrasis kona]
MRIVNKAIKNQVQKQAEQIQLKDIELHVSRSYDGVRLDKFITSILKDNSKKNIKGFQNINIPNHGFMQSVARKKKILLNGAPQNVLSTRVSAFDKITIPQSLFQPLTNSDDPVATNVPKIKKTLKMTPDKIKEVRSWVIFKNSEVIVINKPYGLAVQGGTKQNEYLDGMLEALRFDYEEDPKLVHRLDKDTSGVLVLARNVEGARRMSRWISEKDLGLKKMYWAIVAGKPKPSTGRIKMFLEKVQGSSGEKVYSRDTLQGDAKIALTEYKLIDNAGDYLSWLVMYPITGRLHQLRVNCSTGLGCDIIGDYKYGVGCPDSLKNMIVTSRRVKMHLHARSIVLPYTEDGKNIIVKAEVSPHMAETMKEFGFDEKRGDKMA